MLQTRVLILKRTQSLGIAHRHATVIRVTSSTVSKYGCQARLHDARRIASKTARALDDVRLVCPILPANNLKQHNLEIA
jgi:hypothetical protein